MSQVIVTSPEQIQSIFEATLAKYLPVLPMPKENTDETYIHSLDELANFLGCSIGTAYKLKKSGRIRYRQYGRKLIFTASEVLADISKNKRK
jgi:excisionase family DNA binding protein